MIPQRRPGLAVLVASCALSATIAAGPPPRPQTAAAIERLKAASAGRVTVRIHAATGVARRVRLEAGALPLAGATPAARVRAFLRAHGAIFGVRDPDTELVPTGEWTDSLGQTHLRLRQVYLGVPVFAAELRAHTNAAGRVVEVGGSFVPDLSLETRPRIDAAQAGARAVMFVRDEVPRASARRLHARETRLVVFRTGLVERLPGEAHLAWEVEVEGGDDVREQVWVDAATGKVLDRITRIHSAIHRTVHEPAFQNVVIWDEGDPLPYFTGDAANDGQVNELIDVSSDAHDFFLNLSGGTFPSWDGAEGTMHTVWNIGTSICPNAFWNGVSANFCYGVAGDDSAIHEWVHAYTDSTHGLIYRWQSGALNESYSDMYGELLDQLNARGTDAPAGPRSTGSCSLYGGTPPPTLEILSPAPIAGVQRGGAASFGPVGPLTVAGRVQLASDGTPPTSDACQPLVGFVAGRIALVDRGTCTYATKLQNAQNAGAVGVIVVNTSNYAQRMSGTSSSVTVPSIMIGKSRGDLIKAQLGAGVDARLRVTPPTDASLRWLMGEDDPAFGGVIRDMWAPECLADPGKVSDSEFYVCDGSDDGGVHTNSGIPNHAFTLLLDGGSFNGHTVAALGPVRTAHVYWRAMSVYEVPDTDFADHADALEQSCADLIGASLVDPMSGLTTSESVSPEDCQQIDEAMAAVEMRDAPTFCAFQPLLTHDAPPTDCGTVDFVDDFESDPSQSWTRSNSGVFAEYAPRDWAWTSDLPDGGDGSAFFAADDPHVGDCVPGSDDQSGVMRLTSPSFVVGSAQPLLTFDHWVATEAGYDGGQVSVSVNGGPFQLVPTAAFRFNPYNLTLQSSGSGNTNPLAGLPAFSGTDGGTNNGSWGQSQVDLSGLAGALDTVRLRFDLGADGCNGSVGWYVDDVRVCEDCAGAGGADADGDGFRACDGDCAPDEGDTFPGAPEVNDGLDNQCPGSAGFGLVDEVSGTTGFRDMDPERYSWDAQTGATAYEVARALSPDFTLGCTTFPVTSSFLDDPELPSASAAFFYLVRSATPNTGAWGEGRTVPCAVP